MEINKAMGPVEFRFTDPEDVAQYGDRWYRYSEADLIRTRARDLVKLENEIGMSIVDAMNGMRASTALGDLAAAWIGVRNADPNLAGSFDNFNPLVLSLTWRAAVSPGKEPSTAPVEPDMQLQPEESSTNPNPSPSETSGRTVTVALQTLPTVG